MSKRRHSVWDDDTFEFQNNGVSHKPSVIEPSNMAEPVEADALYLEEAHEALSKLFNKTNKRARLMRGVRRKDAWQ